MTNATNDIKWPIVEILKSEKGTLDKINNFNNFFGGTMVVIIDA